MRSINSRGVGIRISKKGNITLSSIQSNTDFQGRRRSESSPIESGKHGRFLLGSFAPFISRFKLQDIVTARHHSEDFIETRAEYIALRMRFMTAFYVISAPLWIPIDYFLLSAEHFNSMIIPRLSLMTFLALLGFLSLRKLTSNQIHVILALNILGAGIFYAASMLILSRGADESFIAGYDLMPFMMISMLGIFPLTMGWGIALIAIVFCIHLGLVTSLGQLMTANTANSFWVLSVLSGISLWVQSSQLLMLMRLYRESTRDPLTGLINRRVLMKRLTAEIEHIKRGGSSFCIQMFDLDRFKRINDSHGHLVGDKVLQAAANVIQKGLRKNDIVARFGGEEFLAVLPGCTSAEAVSIAERIRQSCYEAQVFTHNGERLQLSTSIGVTEYEQGEAIEVALNRADESLYKAKELGRNCVVHSQSKLAVAQDS